jgi:Domain of unknown function (DUF4145)
LRSLVAMPRVGSFLPSQQFSLAVGVLPSVVHYWLGGIGESSVDLIIGNQLPLERCPHCAIARPTMPTQWSGKSSNHSETAKWQWAVFSCTSCGGHVLVSSKEGTAGKVSGIWPTPVEVPEAVPERARAYLGQAHSSLHTPAGAIMLAASALDSMLKAKGLRDGSLYKRIDEASAAHLITHEMGLWAHEVRLDANDQRHADDDGPLPSSEDAVRVVEFANAVAQFLFVLPARVAKGRAQA